MRKLAAFLVSTLLLLFLVSPPLSAQVGNPGKVVNPNLSTKAQLQKLPHVTAAIAEVLEDGRPYLTMEKLDDKLAEHLGETERQALYVTMFVPINLNAATKREIDLVPGMTRKMHHEFEEYRPYKKLAQFRREMGKYVDKEEVARFEQYVFVPLDLNSATAEEILTIPGVGKRMLHEFEEYRPYRNIAQFRREIGKYVDKNELARLERYVFIKGQKSEKAKTGEKPGTVKDSGKGKKGGAKGTNR